MADSSLATLTPSEVGHISGTSLQENPTITDAHILWGLSGVAVTATQGYVEPNKSSLPTSWENEDPSTLRGWIQRLAHVDLLDDGSRHCIQLAIAISFLVETGRQNIIISPEDLDFVWSLIHDVVVSDSLQFKVSRSSQDFYSIPLWSNAENANGLELLRLHVWIPDDHEQRTPGSNIRTHQALGQGWILTGQNTDHGYEIEPADKNTVTHAEYCISWSNNDSEAGDKISTSTNTGRLLRVVAHSERILSRDMTYTIPVRAYHNSHVRSDELHATLFFDSHRGFQKNSPALGPLHGSTSILPRTAPGATAARQWESHYAQGKQNVRKGE